MQWRTKKKSLSPLVRMTATQTLIELSKGTLSAESAILRPARALKREFPWRPTKGGVGIRRTKRIASACLQRCSATLGSVGSILSKATLLRLPESMNKQTKKGKNKIDF